MNNCMECGRKVPDQKYFCDTCIAEEEAREAMTRDGLEFKGLVGLIYDERFDQEVE